MKPTANAKTESFNPTLVRFELYAYGGCKGRLGVWFQSHIGPI